MPEQDPWPSSGAPEKRGDLFAQCAVAFEMPFAFHRFDPVDTAFGVEQDPLPPARGARTGAGIVTREALLEIVGPADIRARPALAEAAYHVDEGGGAHGAHSDTKQKSPPLPAGFVVSNPWRRLSGDGGSLNLLDTA